MSDYSVKTLWNTNSPLKMNKYILRIKQTRLLSFRGAGRIKVVASRFPLFQIMCLA